MKTLLINAGKCIDCRNCQTACKDEFCDNDWRPLAAPQGPRQYWIRIQNTEVGDGERVRMQRVPLVCQQCADAPCLKAAKDGGAYRREDGIVIFDPEASRGQRAMMEACPYGAVYWNEALDIPQKCTLCAHLLDAGRQPRCVTACPTDALRFVDSDDFADDALLPQPVERLRPELGTGPRVLYQDLPRPFIAGDVCSGDGVSVLPGVSVRAEHQTRGLAYEAVTDEFGDFTLDGVEPGFYTLTFAGEGLTRKTLANMEVIDALNVGSVRLYPLA